VAGEIVVRFARPAAVASTGAMLGAFGGGRGGTGPSVGHLADGAEDDQEHGGKHEDELGRECDGPL